MIYGTTMIHGIDVSNHQLPIDWEAAKGSGRCDFAYIKTSEGSGFVDWRAEEHASGAASAGVKWGPYHFARPSLHGDDGATEARHFADTIRALPVEPTLPAMLDLEVTELPREATTAWIRRFAEVLGPELGSQPWPRLVLYTGAFVPFANADLARRFWLWLAAYPSRERDPDWRQLPVPGPRPTWTRWDLWQYTSRGVVPGIPGEVDRNVARPEWWAAVVGAEPEPSPEPSPEPRTPSWYTRLLELMED